MYQKSLIFALFMCFIAVQIGGLQNSGVCPPLNTFGTCTRQCDKDESCLYYEKCCPNNCGGKSCALPTTEQTLNSSRNRSRRREKNGFCPRAHTVHTCIPRCGKDEHCSFYEKCCSNSCGGKSCVFPNPEQTLNTDGHRGSHRGEKSGICPSASTIHTCIPRCGMDKHCDLFEKCCPNNCGSMSCVVPNLG
ncbi:hypothetical protein KM043_010835 [Ampulex compressa]|nr:hypothetical protein KM043_010835 [Ampulex compressa]